MGTKLDRGYRHVILQQRKGQVEALAFENFVLCLSVFHQKRIVWGHNLETFYFKMVVPNVVFSKWVNQSDLLSSVSFIHETASGVIYIIINYFLFGNNKELFQRAVPKEQYIFVMRRYHSQTCILIAMSSFFFICLQGRSLIRLHTLAIKNSEKTIWKESTS